MLHRKKFILILTCLIALAGQVASAQQPGALAVVNEQTITLSDIDPRVSELVKNLDKEIAEVRRRVLDEQINAVLFEAEAKKRRISVARLLELDVTRLVVDPTAEEIQAIYDANRAQFGSIDLNTARPQLVAYLRRASEEKLLDDLAARLRKRYPVVMGVDVNSPKMTLETTLATVAGRVLTAGSIIERLKPAIYDLRIRVYEAEKTAVEQMIYNLLVLDAARRQGVGPEVIIRTEITEKMRSPTEDEIAKFYEENKARLNNTDLASSRTLIVNYLEQQQTANLESALREKLSASANVRVLLTEPEPPVLAVSADDDPSRGELSAPVTVVVFTDFQCPACAYNHPLIEEAIKAYGNRVRLVVRDFPLEMHANARKAAEAANAAHAQGKFFEYAGLLFKNQKALDVPSLKKYATEVGLNRTRFDAALDGGTYAAEVNHDVADGLQYGVAATPTVFVNGVQVRHLSAETLRAAIDRALAQKNMPAAANPGGTTK
jgi:protein-disulfide isomerase/NAD(P)-dependent dehydrogenase (short-subunit alcohol dehydrogenase family)